MSQALPYIVDESGQKTTVLVPVALWESLNDKYQKLQAKFAVFESIKSGMEEVKRVKKSGETLPTLKEFLK